MSKNKTSTDKENHSAHMAVIVFPLIILVAAAFGILFPDASLPLNSAVPYLLGLVMFTMGLTITAPDLKIIVKKPQAVLIGFVAQYTIMPLTALGIGLLFQLDPLLIVGMVLLGSTPGGASSNIVAYLAGGNVALSVSMTTLSTLLAPFMTPLLVLWLAGSYLPVSFLDMANQILQMVIVPVVLGLGVRFIAKKFVEKLAPLIPWMSVLVLSLVIVGIMAGNAEVFLGSAFVAIAAVILHNIVGFSLGYFAARLGGLERRERRAVAVEVGMQNAGLAAALANSNYAPLAALPAAIATIWHNVGGALLSFIFGFADQSRKKREQYIEPSEQTSHTLQKSGAK